MAWDWRSKELEKILTKTMNQATQNWSLEDLRRTLDLFVSL
jgi:hypothetical protein